MKQPRKGRSANAAKPSKPAKPAAKKTKPARAAASPRRAKASGLPPLARCLAIVVTANDGGVTPRLTDIPDDVLRASGPPEADVMLRVLYSTVNFKDGLALFGRGGVVKRYPHVPGVDLVGVVEESQSTSWRPGDLAIMGGFRMGELYWGGFAQRARVRGDWLVALPETLTPLRAMAIGTAGLTSMLAVIALEEHGLLPASGEIVVTGAAGGVGSVAVALLSALGFHVTAVTGRRETHGYLKRLGAGSIIDRAVLAVQPDKPLLPARYAGAIDTVGGTTLATLLASLNYGGSVAATGLVGGRELSTTVIPFLLRGINLLGIEGTNCPMPKREAAWRRLARDLPMSLLDNMTSIVPLAKVPEIGRLILEGKIQGRVVVDVNA
jgi:acrylyl-CoA reductase (NADPH)